MTTHPPRRRLGILAYLAAWFTLLISAPTMSMAQPGMTVRVLESEATFPEPAAVVEILGADGRPVTGLRPEQFTLLQNGRPVAPNVIRVSEVLTAKQGPMLAVVVDASKLLGAAEVEAARAAAVALLQTPLETTPADPQYVTLFVPAGTDGQASHVAEFAGFTHDHNAVVNYLNTRLELQPGITRLYAVVREAILAVSERASARGTSGYVAVFSDGRDQLSTSQFEEALALARESKVRILSVRYGSGEGGEAGSERLQRLADASGGLFLNAPTPAQVSEGYARIGEVIPRSTYQISFTSDLPPDDEVHSWQLLVNVDGVELQSQRILFQAILPGKELRPLGTILGDYLWRAVPALILVSGVLTLGVSLWQRSTREDSRRLGSGLSDAATLKSPTRSA